MREAFLRGNAFGDPAVSKYLLLGARSLTG
jgi:hypothetical protein